jgi:hypothetical protein
LEQAGGCSANWPWFRHAAANDATEKAMLKSGCICLLASMMGLIAAGATASDDVPHRKAGWWQMTMHVPGGGTMVRNLCLDATSDIRNNILKPREGCTMDATKIAGGYSYKKVCGGETTTGTAIGDFNSAYKIEESKGSMHVRTDALWMGACPAGHQADQMWLD